MSEYVLLNSIFSFMFAIVWSKDSIPNLLTKVSLYVNTIWGAYLMFGPTNLITQFAK